MPLPLIAAKNTNRSLKLLLNSIKRPFDNTIIFSYVLDRHYTTPGGDPGAGAGKGGGAGGSIKEAGGGLGRWQVAQEEGYFYNKQREQLKKIKKQLQSENPDLTLKKKDK